MALVGELPTFYSQIVSLTQNDSIRKGYEYYKAFLDYTLHFEKKKVTFRIILDSLLQIITMTLLK